MRVNTAIGPYRTAVPLGPDTWSVDGPQPGCEARRIDGRPTPDFDVVCGRLVGLRHPHLWPVFAAARIDGRAWIVRTPVEGGTLADRLAAGHRPPYKVAIDVGVAVLKALSAAHQAGLSHGALDAGCIAWSDGLRVVGVGYGALVGRVSQPVDDVRAVGDLLRDLVPDPPGELRALLASPLDTADALCRALKTLDPALSQDRDFDFGAAPSTSSPPEPAAPTLPPPVEPRLSPPADPPPAPPPARAPGPPPGEDTWGVAAPPDDARPPSRGTGWVVESRDMVQASTEDTWGIGASPEPPPPAPAGNGGGMRRDHTGAIVHTVSSAGRPAPARAPRNPLATAAVVIAVLAVGLVGARIVMNQLADSEALPDATVSPGIVAFDGGPLDAATPSTAGATDGGAAGDGAAGDGAADADLRARVTLIIGPIPGRVVRVEDKAVICDAARRCAVPIDIDYRVEAKGYVSQSISGDDLYDRRRIGEYELVLQPTQPKQRKRRRRQ